MINNNLYGDNIKYRIISCKYQCLFNKIITGKIIKKLFY